MQTRMTRILCACLAAVSAFSAVCAAPSAVAEVKGVASGIKGKASVLVASTRGDNILRYDQNRGEFLGEHVASGAGGLSHPDTMILGPDGRLYVSSGETPAGSAILRFDLDTGAFIDVFASGHGMRRPYGMAFGPDDKLYVASFLSDQILRFDASTGAFIDVFATGNGQPGGLNGPNSLLFDKDNTLYVSTEGSIAVDGVATFPPDLRSQILQFDIATGQSEVFADQPPPSPEGAGFVSLLALAFGPDCTHADFSDNDGKCDLFVSDFAGDVRRYNAAGEIIQVLSTNYTGTLPSQNFVGGLSFGKKGRLFVAAFNNVLAGNPGAILRYDGDTGTPLPATGQPGATFVPQSPLLVRPIGILAVQ